MDINNITENVPNVLYLLIGLNIIEMNKKLVLKKTTIFRRRWIMWLNL